jgi:hypothetical protein
MIRNTMLGLSLFAFLSGSALAATPAKKHVSKPVTVAAAPAGDSAKEPAKADAPKADAPKADAPKTDAPKTDKKPAKKTTKKDKAGDAAKTEMKGDMKSAPAPETK